MIRNKSLVKIWRSIYKIGIDAVMRISGYRVAGIRGAGIGCRYVNLKTSQPRIPPPLFPIQHFQSTTQSQCWLFSILL